VRSPRNVSRRARKALCTLALVAFAGGAHADEPKTEPKSEPKIVDTSTKRASLEVASYTDSDHVTVFTPSIAASVENVVTGASLHGRYLVDVVSAASVDIVSTASRKWHETRQAGSLGGEYKPHDFGVSVAGSVSSEPDYLSYGASVGISKDFDEKNTTLSFGYGFSHDIAGRSSTPFSVFSRELQRGSFNGGISQVIDRSSVLSLSFDLMIENGDQSKPYRYIPMFSADVASQAARGASIGWVTDHRLPERPLEQLPLARRRFAFTPRWARRFDGSTLRLEERIYDDSWGLLASTTDAKWIIDLGRRFALWPHTRFHVQSPVSFWRRAYVSGPGWDLPEYRTGDRELGSLWTFTAGGGIKWYLGTKAEPTSWAVSLQGDAMYTSYADALYLTDRTAFLGAFIFEGEL
jgi:hypothetical protein